jgi:phosphoribosylamine--glycine ligase
MKVLVVGGGGREHAIIKKIKENPSVDKIYALPGNGGIAEDAECVAIGAKDIDKIVEFAVATKSITRSSLPTIHSCLVL